MPAKGLKIVGTGACFPWCSISSSFQNSLKMSGHRGYEFLEFCWNLVPFLPDIGFQLLKSLWSSLTYFSFNDAPNARYRWKIWTAGRPIQHPDSSTTKPCCFNSCSMWFCIEIHVTAEIHVIWREAYVALKPLYFQHSCLPKHASCPCPYLCTPIPSEMLAFELKAENSLEGLPPL